MAARAKRSLYRDAIRDGLRHAMERDPAVFVTGECIEGESTWGPTAGLDSEFPGRVVDTPISEAAIIGHAMGAALMGLRPVVEIMIGDFLTCAMDEIVNQVAKVRLMSGGQLRAPLTIRAATGTGRSSAGQHSQSFESWFVHVPGLIVAAPSTAQDAYDILTTAIAGDDPTLIFEYKRLYPLPGEWTSRAALGTADIGSAAVRQEGRDCTVIATGTMLYEVTAASQALGDAISVEIIDPRYLWPLDMPTIQRSAEKTRRVLVVEEEPGVVSFGTWLEAEISRRCFGELDRPVARLSGAYVPRAFAPQLEAAATPNADLIREAIVALVKDSAHASN